MGLCVLAAIALHPELGWFAGAVLSDYLFALLVVASALAADEAWLNFGRRSLCWGVVAGLMLGLSMLTRSAGIGVIAGIALYGALQRRWRTLFIILIVCVALIGIGLAATHALSAFPVAAGSGTPPTAFQQVTMYDSSYARFWLLSVPKLSVLGAMLRTNSRMLLLAPGNYFVMLGVALPANVFTFALALLVTALSVGGMARLWRSSARRTIFFAALGSLPILLLWNYVLYDRFLLPFVPLIFLGVAIELRRMVAMLNVNVRQGNGRSRILAGTISALLIGVIAVAVRSYVRTGHVVEAASQTAAALNRQQREAYEWIARDNSPSERIIARADGLTYLFTDRQAVRPIEMTTDCVYQPERERCTINPDDLTASIRYVGARYWISTPSDFEVVGAKFGPDSGLRERVAAALKSRLEPPFVSSDGSVIVYNTACLSNPNDSTCTKSGINSKK